MTSDQKNSLFKLSEYANSEATFFREAVREMMAAKDQLYAKIRTTEPSEVLPVTQNTMPSGQVLQNKPLSFKWAVHLKFDDIIACNLDALSEQVDKSADEELAQVMPYLFQILHRTSDAVGNATDAAGNPFSFELYLQGLESIELRFDRNGIPALPALVMHPKMAAHLRSLPPLDADQQKALADLIERKRVQFNASRRHRKLH